MYRRLFLLTTLGSCLVGLAPATGPAQQLKLTTPYQQLSDKFYENFNVHFGFSGKGFFFNPGVANSTPPPFGGYDPAADARFGFGMRGSNGGFNLGITAGEGSNRTNTVTAPTIVIPNGGSGSLFDGSQQPFVTGVVPVVGNGMFSGIPMAVPSRQSSLSPLQERLLRVQQGESASQSKHAPTGAAAEAAEPQPIRTPEAPLVLRNTSSKRGGSRPDSASASGSTANHGDLSVKEILSQQAVDDSTRQAEIAVRLEKARGYEEAGRLGIAKVYYQQAAARATGDQKRELLEKLQALSGSASR